MPPCRALRHRPAASASQFDAQQREKKNSKYAGLERAAQRENDEFLDEKRDEVQQIHAEQDFVLEDMSVILKSIGVMAEEMQSEIADQGKHVYGALCLGFVVLLQTLI